MALISCYECSTELSTAAAACPKCGAPNKGTAQPVAAKTAPKTRPVFKVLGGILVALFALAMIGKSNNPASGGATTAATSGTPEAESTAQATPAMPVDASELSTAYKANEVAADMKYKGKRLVITATVASINKDFSDAVWVGLVTDNEFMPIHAEGLGAEQVSGLKKGDQIKITCVGGGMIVGSPILKNCS